MNNLDYIKTYLIKVGVDVDNNSVTSYDQFIKKTDSKLGNLVKKMGSYGVKINAFWDTLLVGAYKGASSIAKADMELQRLSKHMYMSRDSAKALKTTLDAMGLDQGDLQDIALNPELTNQYRELLRLSHSLGTPQGVKDTLKDIRSIGFEFSKLNVIISHFMERVVHFAFRTLGKPAKDFKKFLQDFNNKFAKNIDSWAKKIGTGLGIIVRLAFRFKELLHDVGSYISTIWSKLDKLQKGIILAIGAIGLALKASPLWGLMTLISGFLMLIDDYKVYKEGGVSAKVLKPLWKQLDDQRENPDSIYNKAKKGLRSLEKDLDTWWEQSSFKRWWDNPSLFWVDLDTWWEQSSFKRWWEQSKFKKWYKDLETWWEQSKFKKWWDNLSFKNILKSLDTWWEQSSFKRWWDKLLRFLGLREDKSGTKIYGSGKKSSGIETLISQNAKDTSLPTNPWSPEGYERLQRIMESNKVRSSNSVNPSFESLPTNPWNLEKTSINQTFNFKLEGVDNPEQFAKEFSTIVRNNKPKLVS